MNTEQKFTAPTPVTVDESLLTRFRDAANETDRDPFTIIPIFLFRIETAINNLKGLTCPSSEATGITVEQHREMICLELALLLLEKQIPGYAFEGLAAYCKFCNEDSNIRYHNGTVKLLLRYATPSNNPVYPPIWAYANGTWGWEVCIGNVRPDYQMLLDGRKGRDTLRPYLEKIDAS